MAIKDTPIGIKAYFNSFKETYKTKLDATVDKHKELVAEETVLYDQIKLNKDSYDNKLFQYEEFINNKYIDGKFKKAAKGAYLNRGGDYELTADLFNLMKLANLQETINDLEHKIELYSKCCKLKFNDYAAQFRGFMTEVHKKMILEGYGYSYGHGIGTVLFNRCHIVKTKPRIDYKATKLREAQLKAEGKKIYNKEEADWCREHGIEYKAEDKRVFTKKEYVYEMPLLYSTLKEGHKLKLDATDYRHVSYRGKTNEDLITMANNDTTKICELVVDPKTKLTLCNQVDKILYTNFIRNENQTPARIRQTNSKN